MPKYLPYLRGGIPLGRNVDPVTLDPTSNPAMLDDWVCNSEWVDPIFGSICGICAVRGRIP